MTEYYGPRILSFDEENIFPIRILQDPISYHLIPSDSKLKTSVIIIIKYNKRYFKIEKMNLICQKSLNYSQMKIKNQ